MTRSPNRDLGPLNADEQTRKLMIAACQRTLEVLYATPLPTEEQCDEIYHALQRALVHVPFTSEKTKSRARRKAKEAARKGDVK